MIAVEADALAGPGRAGDQQVRHLGQVANDVAAVDVAPERDRQLVLAPVNVADSSVSRNPTVATFAFGISIPTRAMPGTGASMRMLGAASASARSFCSSVIRRTLMPRPAPA